MLDFLYFYVLCISLSLLLLDHRRSDVLDPVKDDNRSFYSQVREERH